MFHTTEATLFWRYTFLNQTTNQHPPLEFQQLLSSLIFFPPGATQLIVGFYFTALYRALASLRTRLLDHTQRHATVGRTPLKE
jgi:hypothetical protein